MEFLAASVAISTAVGTVVGHHTPKKTSDTSEFFIHGWLRATVQAGPFALDTDRSRKAYHRWVRALENKLRRQNPECDVRSFPG